MDRPSSIGGGIAAGAAGGIAAGAIANRAGEAGGRGEAGARPGQLPADRRIPPRGANGERVRTTPGQLPAGGIEPRRGGDGFNQRPSWANIDKSRIDHVNGKWGDAINHRDNWGKGWGNGRDLYWDGWADNIRDNWHGDYDFDLDIDDIDGNFWGWHYGWGGYYREYDDDWWIAPAWGAVYGFYSVPSEVYYPEPIIYDYGTGGNVVYQDDGVYIGGEQVATAEEFAQSAGDLSTVEPPASEEASKAAEWLALGRFAMTTDKDDKTPNRTIELAVNKEGIIAGTFFNTDTGKGSAIQGKVDKKTQRVAFRLGESDQCIIETGIYNLTLDQAPCLVHFGTEKVENYLLVRLPAPDEVISAQLERTSQPTQPAPAPAAAPTAPESKPPTENPKPPAQPATQPAAPASPEPKKP